MSAPTMRRSYSSGQAPRRSIPDDGSFDADVVSSSSNNNSSMAADLRNKIVRAFSNTRTSGHGEERERESRIRIVDDQAAVRADRSRSRGRDVTPIGRGGAGNMVRSASVSREDENVEFRGRRELPTTAASNNPDSIATTHVGRGGAGNVRSPSTPRTDPADARRQDALVESGLIDPLKNANATVAYSTGRGGAGNIRRSPNNSVSPARSRSRDPAPGRRYQSTGRGGAGNIRSTEAELGKVDEIPTSDEDEDERGRSGDKHPHGLTGLVERITGHHHNGTQK